MEEKYGLYSEFDIKKHKETFVNYLEVLILPNGKVVYAVPSHQAKAEELAANRRHQTVQQLRDSCPPEHYGDYLEWLLFITGACAVWNNKVVSAFPLTEQQNNKLKLLKINGFYKGPVLVKRKENEMFIPVFKNLHIVKNLTKAEQNRLYDLWVSAGVSPEVAKSLSAAGYSYEEE